MNQKIVFLGTPEISAKALQGLLENGFNIVAVVTKEDKVRGRNNTVEESPVAIMAKRYHVPVYKPHRLNKDFSFLQEIQPDLLLTFAYGQLISDEVLALSKYKPLNLHASLLPKYRGATPIEASILSGDEKTGVTIMYMAKGLDTGDIISQADILIGKHNTETLTAELSKLGADLVVKTISDIEAGRATRTAQNEEESCYAGKLDKAMGQLDFTKTAVELERLVRAFYPWPCAYTGMDGKTLKILEAQCIPADETDEVFIKMKKQLGDEFADRLLSGRFEAADGSSTDIIGKVIGVNKKIFAVGTGDGALVFTKLQPEGKKPMDTVAFLNGYKVEAGTVLKATM